MFSIASISFRIYHNSLTGALSGLCPGIFSPVQLGIRKPVLKLGEVVREKETANTAVSGSLEPIHVPNDVSYISSFHFTRYFYTFSVYGHGMTTIEARHPRPRHLIREQSGTIQNQGNHEVETAANDRRLNA